MQHNKTLTLSLAVLAVVLPATAQQGIQPAPVMETTPGTILPAQPIGVEDLLSLQVYDSPEFSRSVRVSSDGTIRLPMLKDTIRVQGLLPKDIETLVAEALQRAQLLVDPFVTVNVVEYHSRPINVMGAVRSPTIFQVVGNTTLMDALAKAGGLIQDQAGSEIFVTKPNGDGNAQSIQRIPVKALISGSEPELNLKLTGGETIRVPDVGKFTVAGNVNHPGLYPMIDGNPNTVITAIAQAQGTAQYYSDIAYIYRTDDKGTPHEIPIKLQDIIRRKAPDVAILAKDVLYVPDSRRKRLNGTIATTMTGMGVSAAMSLIYLGIIK